jgi:hypothetical protein
VIQAQSPVQLSLGRRLANSPIWRTLVSTKPLFVASFRRPNQRGELGMSDAKLAAITAEMCCLVQDSDSRVTSEVD